MQIAPLISCNWGNNKGMNSTSAQFSVCMQSSTDLLSQIRPETCRLSVDVKPLVLMRRPGSRVIMEACDGWGSLSYKRGSPLSTPSCASNRPSELRAPLCSCLSWSLIVGRGLIYTSDKICAAPYTLFTQRLSTSDAAVCVCVCGCHSCVTYCLIIHSNIYAEILGTPLFSFY